MEAIQFFQYKLRMMRVPISGPSYIYGDNMSIIYNNQCLEYTLKKKSNSIFNHTMKESVEMGEELTNNITTNDNPLDLTTRVIAGQKIQNNVGIVLYG